MVRYSLKHTPYALMTSTQKYISDYYTDDNHFKNNSLKVFDFSFNSRQII